MIHPDSGDDCSIIFNKQKRQHRMAVAHYPIGDDRYVKVYEFPLQLQGTYGFFTFEKFINEIRFQSRASQLQHDMFSVPKIFQYGEVQQPVHANQKRKILYFMMEYIVGHPISPVENAEIITQADTWLKRNCIVHNDLHTIGNIIKTSDDKYSIIDFGEASTEQDRHRCPFGRSVLGGTRRNT
jgi:serine/threonine protein kinase